MGFVQIHPFVGRGDQRGHRRPVLGQRTDTDADAECQKTMRGFEPHVGDRLLQEALLRGSPLAPQLIAAKRAALLGQMKGGKIVLDMLQAAHVHSSVQLALMMGDYRAADLLGGFEFESPAPAYVMARAARNATAELARLDAERRSRGLPPLTLQLRPGAEEWRRLMDEGQSAVVVPRG